MARPCLGCGQLIHLGSRCAACRPKKAATTIRGYGWSWQQLARRVIAKQPWCSRCGTTGSQENPLTADHVVAKADGGTDDESNLQTLCRRCNASKGGGSKRSPGERC